MLVIYFNHVFGYYIQSIFLRKIFFMFYNTIEIIAIVTKNRIMCVIIQEFNLLNYELWENDIAISEMYYITWIVCMLRNYMFIILV